MTEFWSGVLFRFDMIGTVSGSQIDLDVKVFLEGGYVRLKVFRYGPCKYRIILCSRGRM